MAPRRGASAGMDDALRYQQQLQFCKQLHVLQQQLCEQTRASDELLASLYALYKFSYTPASCLMQITEDFPEFASKLQRAVKPHPLKDLHVEQMAGDAVEAVVTNAEQLEMVLKPMYKELQALGKFVRDAGALLADLHQLLIPVTMATAPQVIEFFMTLFCNTARIVLLMDKVPWRLLVQVYTIVTTALDGNSPQGRTAVVELLDRLQEPVQFLQELFQPISSRISQILELAVSTVLDHLATVKVLERSSVFDITRLGQMQLGITGLSLSRTYSFLQRLDDFRSWAQLGFLACPAALQGVHAQTLLTALLQDTFLLPVYGDVTMPLHALYQQHVASLLEQVVSAQLQGSSNKADTQQQVQDARQLVTKCYQAAVQGAEAEHAARRRHICRVLQEILLCLQDEAWQSPDALSMALAAQAYAKSELLWYFRHVGEKLPTAPTAGSGVSGASKLVLPLLSSQPLGPQIAEDGHVVTLAAAVTAMYDFLEEHESVLQGHELATMQALLEQQVLPGTAAVVAATAPQDNSATDKNMVVPRVLVPLAKAIVLSLADLAEVHDTTLPVTRSTRPGEGAQQQQRISSAGTDLAEAPLPAETSCGQASTEPAAELCRSAEVAISDIQALVLSRVQQDMVYLTMLLSSRNLWMRPAVLEAPAQDPQYLAAIHKLLDLCPFAKFFLPALERSCSLNHLVHYQHKLLQLQHHVLQSTDLAARERLAGCPSLTKVLHWFEYNLPVAAADGEGPRDYAAEAKQLACQMLEEQCGMVALFLTDMAQELDSGLYVAQLTAAQVFLKPSKPSPASTDGVADTATQQDAETNANSKLTGLHGASAVAGGAAHASKRSRAAMLAHALDQIGPVKVSSDRLVMPVEYLRAALQQCLLLQVNDMVLKAPVPPIPSQLVRCLHDLLWASAELHQVLAIDVRPGLWQVLLNHSQPDWVVPTSCRTTAAARAWGSGAGAEPHDAQAAGGADAAGNPIGPDAQTTQAAYSSSGIPVQLHSIVQAYGEWYMQYVVRDAKGLGVLYAPQMRRFTCVAGQVDLIQQRASLPELTALLQMFGPYAALKLAEMSEGVVLDCLSQLDSCLARWKELLDPVTMAVVRDDSCADAVSAACGILADEGQVLTQARQLSRCLAFRQLLAEALATALDMALPVIGATIHAVASNASTDITVEGWSSAASVNSSSAGACGASDVVAGRHVCDLFELPRPGLQGVGSPVLADPIVVNTLVGGNSYDRYKAWFNLPALLGLCLNSPTMTTTSINLADHTMANELHALVHAAKCLALAQEQAANKVLTCGSKFLHPEADNQAGDMLACFAKVAATTMYLRNDTVTVRTCKQLLLESLSCPQLSPSQLKTAWLPASRVRSALSQAVL